MSGLQTTGAVATSRKQLFKASGSFTVPAGVTTIYVTAVAGGPYHADAYLRAGRSIVYEPVAVTPGQSLTVTIGAKGAVGPIVGGDTSVGALSTSSSALSQSGPGPGPLAPFGCGIGGFTNDGAAMIEW